MAFQAQHASALAASSTAAAERASFADAELRAHPNPRWHRKLAADMLDRRATESSWLPPPERTNGSVSRRRCTMREDRASFGGSGDMGSVDDVFAEVYSEGCRPLVPVLSPLMSSGRF